MEKIKHNWTLQKRGIVYDERDINRLKHFYTEKLDHWLTKAILFYQLRDLNHNVITEFEITGLGIGDVLDLTTNTQYEIEISHGQANWNKRRNQYKQAGVDIIIVPTQKLSGNIKERYQQINAYIRPD